MLRPSTPRTHQPAGRRWSRTTTAYGPVWGSSRRPSPYLWRKPTSPARAPVDRKGPATMVVMPSWWARKARAVATALAASPEPSGFLGGGGVVGVGAVGGSSGAIAGLVGWPAAWAAVAVGACRVVSATVVPIPAVSTSVPATSSGRMRRMRSPLGGPRLLGGSSPLMLRGAGHGIPSTPCRPQRELITGAAQSRHEDCYGRQPGW